MAMDDIFAGMHKSLAGVFGAPSSDGTVTYTPADGSGAIAGIRPVIGASEFQADDGTGALVVYQSRDFLILTSDLVKADGTVYEPQRGDTITEIQDGIARTHKVTLRDPGSPPWRWSDPARQVRRIHTKQHSEA